MKCVREIGFQKVNILKQTEKGGKKQPYDFFFGWHKIIKGLVMEIAMGSNEGSFT